ncbi:putative Tic20 family protein [Catenuloplanes nepalensis]|uniref:Tic20 family protein n=1 Tax=Catenuloplanes nepalensis TaxID=587533 RepID=A0ABT9MJF2_9ACTN|nr:DUF4870 domain-containing protein [Catenuloplanes nepalensis]MDP9791548.1 putative Tic20 family protein [Catenuloplanes nepalensis]
MTEPPRPPGEGNPGYNDPTAPIPPSYSTPPTPDGSYPPPGSGAGAYPPPTSGAGAYPPPTSGAGAYPPPSSGAGGYPPPSSGAGAYPPPPTSDAGAYPPPTSGAGAYPPPASDAGAYPPPGGHGTPPGGYGTPPGGYGTPPGGYGPPPGGGYGQGPQFGAPGHPGSKADYANDDKTWVILSHIGGVLFGFLAPLIVLLVKGNESQIVRAHAVEALNFQITVGLAALVAVVLTACSFGFLFFLPLIVWLAALIFGIMATIKVNDGEWYSYPMTWRVVK